MRPAPWFYCAPGWIVLVLRISALVCGMGHFVERWKSNMPQLWSSSWLYTLIVFRSWHCLNIEKKFIGSLLFSLFLYCLTCSRPSTDASNEISQFFMHLFPSFVSRRIWGLMLSVLKRRRLQRWLCCSFDEDHPLIFSTCGGFGALNLGSRRFSPGCSRFFGWSLNWCEVINAVSLDNHLLGSASSRLCCIHCIDCHKHFNILVHELLWSSQSCGKSGLGLRRTRCSVRLMCI